MITDPDLPRSEQIDGDCNATDGFSVCTEPAGHGPTHWDRRTQHEWSDSDAIRP